MEQERSRSSAASTEEDQEPRSWLQQPAQETQWPTTDDLLAEQRRKLQPPLMGTIPNWMLDFARIGGATGLALALTTWLLDSATPLPLLLFTPLLLAVTASIAGAVAGLCLRALRGQTHPAVGVFLAALATNATGSFLTLSRPDVLAPAAALIEGRAGPLALVVTLLLPVLAVLRWRKERTWPWTIGLGALAGALIALLG